MVEHAGQKLGIIYNNENWLLKFPKSTKNFSDVELSYSTSPLSEYIGSHIYEVLGIPVHKTLLGKKDNKIVVACKDFRENAIDYRFEDYNSITNRYVEGLEEKISSTSSSNLKYVDLTSVFVVMDNNPIFLNNKELKERFWDMFVVDALIGNNDRNNGNWGILVNNFTNEISVAPVFDNGSSFGNNIDDNKIKRILENEGRFKQSAYESRICIFSNNDKPINPLKYIESMKNEDCNEAVKRIVPKVNKDKIKKIIYDIPNSYDGLEVISDVRQEFYYKCMEYRIDKVLLPTYENLKDNY